jgi:membrane protein DedA with SNARE-associated domain
MPHIHYHLIILWLHQHAQWGGVAAFIIAFAESVAIIGSIVPGSVTMTAVGVLIGSGVLPIWGTLIWVVSGAFVGDGLSYLIGFYFKDNVRRCWPFSRYPRIISVGETFFFKHGGKSVFIGRFVGPVRAIVPVIAGMLKMSPKRYFPISCITAIFWAPIYMLPGIALGAISLTMPADIAAKLIIFILLMLVIVWLIFWGIKIIYQTTHRYFAAILDRKWQQWLKQPSKYWICNLLRHAEHPYSHGQLLLASIMLISAALFFLVSIDAVLHGPIVHWENNIYHLLRGLRTDMLDKIAVIVMSFGYHKILSLVVAVLIGWLALRRRWLAMIHWLIAWAGVLTSVFLFKILYALSRPPGLLNAPAMPSFPSRYVTASIVFYILFAFMFTRDMHKEIRKYIYWIAAIICIAVALARLYLGLNWLTDIIAGFCLGGAIVSFVIISYRRYKPMKFFVLGILLIVIVIFAINDVWDLHQNYDNHLHNYQRYWETRVILQDTWWNQTASAVSLYRADRFGRPTQVFNIQWSGSLKEIKATLETHGWRSFHVRSYAAIILQLLQQTDFAKRRPLMTQLYDSRPPVLGMIHYSAPDKPPLVMRLWQTDTVLLPNRTPLWVGAVGYHVVSKHFIFFHTSKLIPAGRETENILKLLSGHVWCVRHITLEKFPKELRRHPDQLRILLIKKCLSR